MIPFSKELTVDIELEGNVFPCGGTTLGDISKKKGWYYFDENLDTEVQLKHWGNNMLNHDTVITTIGDLETDKPMFFIRPCLDRKEFTGTVMTWEDFVNWRNKIKHLVEHGEYTSMGMRTRVAVSPVTPIYSEYRIYVVDGELITWSLYKRGNTIFSSPIVGEAVLDYAREMVKIWCPNRAFVLDIADTPDDYKIIECNSINSSGFYKIDISKFVNAINNMVI